MTTRRNFLIRTVAALVGDLTAAWALASACTWLIQTAALGVFLTFLVWLIGLLLAFALSQHVIHPGVQFLLSDQKLNDTLRTVAGLAQAVNDVTSHNSQRLWKTASNVVNEGWRGLGGLGGFANRFKPT